MKPKQPQNTFLILGVGVIFVAGFMFGSLNNSKSATSLLDETSAKF